MLLTNRRHRMLFLFLAGMEVAWFTPFVLLYLRSRRNSLDGALSVSSTAPVDGIGLLLEMPPPLLFTFFLAIMLVYMLVADLLNQRQVESPQRELLLVSTFVATSLLLTRILFHPGAGFFDFRWIGQVAGGVFNFTTQRRPETAMLVVSAFIWFRVAFNTSRSLTFFHVGLSFRLGLLLMLLGGILLHVTGAGTSADAVRYFLIFMFCALAAVSIARIDEKSIDAEHSSGALLPWSRLLTILAMVAMTLLATGLLTRLYTVKNLRTFFGLFAPLGALLGWLLTLLLTVIFWVITPLINRLLAFMNGLEIFQPEQVEPAAYEPFIAPDVNVNELLAESPALRFGLVTLVILFVLLLIWLYFVRTRARIRADESERDLAAERAAATNPLGEGWRRLQNLLDLVRRYGLRRQLLDAVSVQNIYANVSRIARRRGYPRHPAEAPDAYLEQLRQAFPGLDRELTSITDAYMRVEYGAFAMDAAGMARLRESYRRIHRAPEDEAPRKQ